MECKNCGITPSDLPLEREEAEFFFERVGDDYTCIGCNSPDAWQDFGDGSGYDYYDEEDDR